MLVDYNTSDKLMEIIDSFFDDHKNFNEKAEILAFLEENYEEVFNIIERGNEF